MFIEISVQKFDSSVLPGMYLQCFIVSAQSFFEMFLALHCLTGTAFLSTYGKITQFINRFGGCCFGCRPGSKESGCGCIWFERVPLLVGQS